jgi:geranylgeranyl diphosphate synthase type 3
MNYLNESEKVLIEPVNYYYNIKGKNIRKQISALFRSYLGVEDPDMDKLDEVISIIHNATLVIDDIEDQSLLRRNHPCAHIKFGVPLSLNSAYLCIFKVLLEINQRTDLSESMKHKMVEHIYYAHIGQGMDIYYTQNKLIPTLEDYEKLLEYKTGRLFFTILDFLMEKTTNPVLVKKYPDLRLCLYHFSLFFQIRDDYINLTDANYWKERGFCQDLDEQKISYLIVYCTNHKLEHYRLINKLVTKVDKTKEDKIAILKLMKENGLFDYVYKILVELREKVLTVINATDLFQELPFAPFDLSILETQISKKVHAE